MKERQTISVVTPEGVEFKLRLADPVTRSVAWLLDFLVVMVLFNVVQLLLYFTVIISADVYKAFMVFSFFVISMGYGISCEWFFRGQTIGKRVMKLQVMDEKGLRLHFSQILMRNLMRFIDFFPVAYMTGGLFALFNNRSQRMGDYAARTIVVNLRSEFLPAIHEPISNKYNSIKAHPILMSRIRRNITTREATLALKTVLRRAQLNPDARLKIFKAEAEYFKRLVDFPAECIDNISNEQFVRNIVEVIWASNREALK